MTSLGEFLQQSRKERNVSLDSVADATKLNIKVLQALEQNRLDPLLYSSEVYVKGFVRSYCRFLGIDEKKALALYKQDLHKHDQRIPEAAPEARDEYQRPEGKKMSRLTLLLLLLLLLVVILLGYVVLERRPWKGDATLSLPPPPPAAKEAVPESSPIENQELIEPSQPAEPIKEAVLVEEEEQPVPAPAVPLRVAVKSKARVWVEVAFDNKQPFETMLFAGDAVMWEAAEQIQAKIGNAGGLELEVNGTPLRPFGKPHEVVNLLFMGNTVSVNRGIPENLEMWRRNLEAE